jgi:hypothetical protein
VTVSDRLAQIRARDLNAEWGFGGWNHVHGEGHRLFAPPRGQGPVVRVVGGPEARQRLVDTLNEREHLLGEVARLRDAITFVVEVFDYWGGGDVLARPVTFEPNSAAEAVLRAALAGTGEPAPEERSR